MKIHELEHYMQCKVCGEYFDMRNLQDVFNHEHTGEEIETDNKGEKI